MENSQYKIIIDNISKAYKMYNNPVDKMKEGLSLTGKVLHTDFWALTNVSFNVKKGEILGIMGRNGAGKSTLLKIITGVLKPTYGEINVEGKISSLLELGAGFNMEYSGIENIYFYGMLMKLTKEQIDAKLDDIINFAEIGDYINQPVKTYSSGMFARLAFSCAINVEPEILIVDEILSVGDMRFQAKCFNKFKEFKKKGVTILYVGHDVGLMKTFCDSTIWMNNGKIVMSGDPAYVTSKYIEFMYLDDISEFTTYKMFQNEKKSEIRNKDLIENTQNPNNDFDLERGNLNHWGTQIGLIKEVTIVGNNNKELSFFSSDDEICINITYENNENINYEHFSIAFSIKNVEGTDLLVKTTYDEKIKILKKKGLAKVSFKLKPMLAVGEYYLVVALENRKNAVTMYYEYIEGAKYFKVISNKKIFGVYDANCDIVMN